MQAVTIDQIEERLQQLPAEKLAVVYDFVSYLLEREKVGLVDGSDDSAIQTMIASEEVLARDWNTPEEDEAWAHL
ncbi:MAG: DUF2281 domain-containing protein [Anaerolineae bacterium]|nr:DUF2281 domain-containing protein [Anaerolineae bacterium]